MENFGAAWSDAGMGNTERYLCARCQEVTEHVLYGQTLVCLKCIALQQALVAPPAPATTAAAPSGVAAGSVAAMVGGAAVAIGAFLPWAEVVVPFAGKITRNGIDAGGVGWLFVILGGLLCLTALMNLRRPDAIVRGLWAVMSIGIGAMAWHQITDMTERVASVEARAEVMVDAKLSIGLYVSAVGAAVTFLGSLLKEK